MSEENDLALPFCLIYLAVSFSRIDYQVFSCYCLSTYRLAEAMYIKLQNMPTLTSMKLMAPGLRALAALSEDPTLMPRTHMADLSHL